MTLFSKILMILCGIINILPLVGVVSRRQVNKLYSLDIDSANLEILLRHRAVLLGLLGGFLIYAAFMPALRSIAFVGGLISMVSFVLLAWQIGHYNQAIQSVIIADIVAIALLLCAIAIDLLFQPK